MELKPGYKQTEVGEIPDDWNAVLISSIGQSIIGLTYSPSNVREYGVLVLRSSNIQNGQLAFNDNVYVEMDLPSRVIVEEGDLLICVRNGSRQLIGKCALIDKNTSGSAFGAFMSLYRSDYSKYVLYQFQSNVIQKQIAEVLGATINQITNKDLSRFYIALPPTKVEQTAIANALSDADALIQSLTRLIAKKRQIKQGAMQTLLNPYENGRLKAGWVVKKLGNILRVCHGKSQHEVADKNGKYPILATSGEIGRASKYLYDKPSVLIGRKGTIDVPRYMEYPFWSIDTLFYTEIFEPNNAKYLFYQFNLIDWYSFNEASGVPSLSARTIENIEISLPSPEKQVQIANLLSDMDAEIAALEAKLTKYRHIKQGMMQNLLTGKIRLI